MMAILSSPLARGLFQRAWLMSASPLMNKTAAEASNDNLKFLQATGCSNVSCLRTLSAERISNAVSWNEYPNWAMSDQIGLPTKCLFDGAIAVVDGNFFLKNISKYKLLYFLQKFEILCRI